ncbi:hypothetical protein Agub_g11596, partial [Astrephomene gubernaculifera]
GKRLAQAMEQSVAAGGAGGSTAKPSDSQGAAGASGSAAAAVGAGGGGSGAAAGVGGASGSRWVWPPLSAAEEAALAARESCMVAVDDSLDVGELLRQADGQMHGFITGDLKSCIRKDEKKLHRKQRQEQHPAEQQQPQPPAPGQERAGAAPSASASAAAAARAKETGGDGTAVSGQSPAGADAAADAEAGAEGPEQRNAKRRKVAPLAALQPLLGDARSRLRSKLLVAPPKLSRHEQRLPGWEPPLELILERSREHVKGVVETLLRASERAVSVATRALRRQTAERRNRARGQHGEEVGEQCGEVDPDLDPNQDPDADQEGCDQSGGAHGGTAGGATGHKQRKAVGGAGGRGGEQDGDQDGIYAAAIDQVFALLQEAWAVDVMACLRERGAVRGRPRLQLCALLYSACRIIHAVEMLGYRRRSPRALVDLLRECLDWAVPLLWHVEGQPGMAAFVTERLRPAWAKTWAVPLLDLLAVSYAGEDREGNNEMEFVARWDSDEDWEAGMEQAGGVEAATDAFEELQRAAAAAAAQQGQPQQQQGSQLGGSELRASGRAASGSFGRAHGGGTVTRNASASGGAAGGARFRQASGSGRPGAGSGAAAAGGGGQAGGGGAGGGAGKGAAASQPQVMEVDSLRGVVVAGAPRQAGGGRMAKHVARMDPIRPAHMMPAIIARPLIQMAPDPPPEKLAVLREEHRLKQKCGAAAANLADLFDKEAPAPPPPQAGPQLPQQQQQHRAQQKAPPAACAAPPRQGAAAAGVGPAAAAAGGGGGGGRALAARAAMNRAAAGNVGPLGSPAGAAAASESSTEVGPTPMDEQFGGKHRSRLGEVEGGGGLGLARGLFSEPDANDVPVMRYNPGGEGPFGQVATFQVVNNKPKAAAANPQPAMGPPAAAPAGLFVFGAGPSDAVPEGPRHAEPAQAGNADVCMADAGDALRQSGDLPPPADLAPGEGGAAAPNDDVADAGGDVGGDAAAEGRADVGNDADADADGNDDEVDGPPSGCRLQAEEHSADSHGCAPVQDEEGGFPSDEEDGYDSDMSPAADKKPREPVPDACSPCTTNGASKRAGGAAGAANRGGGTGGGMFYLGGRPGGASSRIPPPGMAAAVGGAGGAAAPGMRKAPPAAAAAAAAAAAGRKAFRSGLAAGAAGAAAPPGRQAGAAVAATKPAGRTGAVPQQRKGQLAAAAAGAIQRQTEQQTQQQQQLVRKLGDLLDAAAEEDQQQLGPAAGADDECRGEAVDMEVEVAGRDAVAGDNAGVTVAAAADAMWNASGQVAAAAAAAIADLLTTVIADAIANAAALAVKAAAAEDSIPDLLPALVLPAPVAMAAAAEVQPAGDDDMEDAVPGHLTMPATGPQQQTVNEEQSREAVVAEQRQQEAVQLGDTGGAGAAATGGDADEEAAAIATAAAATAALTVTKDRGTKTGKSKRRRRVAELGVAPGVEPDSAADPVLEAVLLPPSAVTATTMGAESTAVGSAPAGVLREGDVGQSSAAAAVAAERTQTAAVAASQQLQLQTAAVNPPAGASMQADTQEQPVAGTPLRARPASAAPEAAVVADSPHVAAQPTPAPQPRTAHGFTPHPRSRQKQWQQQQHGPPAGVVPAAASTGGMAPQAAVVAGDASAAGGSTTAFQQAGVSSAAAAAAEPSSGAVVPVPTTSQHQHFAARLSEGQADPGQRCDEAKPSPHRKDAPGAPVSGSALTPGVVLFSAAVADPLKLSDMQAHAGGARGLSAAGGSAHGDEDQHADLQGATEAGSEKEEEDLIEPPPRGRLNRHRQRRRRSAQEPGPQEPRSEQQGDDQQGRSQQQQPDAAAGDSAAAGEVGMQDDALITSPSGHAAGPLGAASSTEQMEVEGGGDAGRQQLMEAAACEGAPTALPGSCAPAAAPASAAWPGLSPLLTLPILSPAAAEGAAVAAATTTEEPAAEAGPCMTAAAAGPATAGPSVAEEAAGAVPEPVADPIAVEAAELPATAPALEQTATQGEHEPASQHAAEPATQPTMQLELQPLTQEPLPSATQDTTAVPATQDATQPAAEEPVPASQPATQEGGGGNAGQPGASAPACTPPAWTALPRRRMTQAQREIMALHQQGLPVQCMPLGFFITAAEAAKLRRQQATPLSATPGARLTPVTGGKATGGPAATAGGKSRTQVGPQGTASKGTARTPKGTPAATAATAAAAAISAAAASADAKSKQRTGKKHTREADAEGAATAGATGTAAAASANEGVEQPPSKKRRKGHQSSRASAAAGATTTTTATAAHGVSNAAVTETGAQGTGCTQMAASGAGGQQPAAIAAQQAIAGAAGAPQEAVPEGISGAEPTAENKAKKDKKRDKSKSSKSSSRSRTGGATTVEGGHAAAAARLPATQRDGGDFEGVHAAADAAAAAACPATDSAHGVSGTASAARSDKSRRRDRHRPLHSELQPADSLVAASADGAAAMEAGVSQRQGFSVAGEGAAGRLPVVEEGEEEAAGEDADGRRGDGGADGLSAPIAEDQMEAAAAGAPRNAAHSQVQHSGGEALTVAAAAAADASQQPHNQTQEGGPDHPSSTQQPSQQPQALACPQQHLQQPSHSDYQTSQQKMRGSEADSARRPSRRRGRGVLAEPNLDDVALTAAGGPAPGTAEEARSPSRGSAVVTATTDTAATGTAPRSSQRLRQRQAQGEPQSQRTRTALSPVLEVPTAEAGRTMEAATEAAAVRPRTCAAAAAPSTAGGSPTVSTRSRRAVQAAAAFAVGTAASEPGEDVGGRSKRHAVGRGDEEEAEEGELGQGPAKRKRRR